MRAARFAGVALVVFAALLVVVEWLRQHGFVAAAVVRDWGEVVLYGDGRGSFRELATAYPPIAFALGVLTGVPIRHVSSIAPPAVTAALLASLLAAHWAMALRSAGYGRWWSLVLTALVCLHPFFLYLATTGVGAVLLLVAVYWFASAYCGSSIRGRVTDFMNLAFALAFTAFVHPLGALICVLALPFLARALPPALIARSALNSMLVLLFPLLFAIASFAYENALFDDGTAALPRRLFGRFATDVRASSAFIGVHPGLVGWASVVGIAGLTLIAAMFAALAPAVLRWREGQGTARPVATLAAIATLAVAAVWVVTVMRGDTANPSVLFEMAAPFVALVVVAARHWPLRPQRRLATAGVLLTGVVLGWSALFLWRSGDPMRWREAVMGTSVTDEQNAGAAALGHYLAARADVLIDASAHPEVLAARGSVRGLVVSTDEAFVLTTLTRQIHCRFIAIPDPDRLATLGDDQLAQTFPELYEHGLPGYRLTYDAYGWRVYERNDARNPV